MHPEGTRLSENTIVPPVLYFPVVEAADRSGPQFVVRRLSDGRNGLLVYTALDRLANCCGDEQQWVLLPIEQLEHINEVQPFDVVAFDLDVPEMQRSGGKL